MKFHKQGNTEGRTVTNCKSIAQTSGIRTTPVERLRQRSRQYYTKLHLGMVDHETVHLVLTNGRDHDLALRRGAWHRILTQLRQQWSKCQAATVYEYKPRRGSHLHIVVKDAPGLTREYVEHLLTLINDGTQLGWFKRVNSPHKAAAYLTKELTNDKVLAGWPRNFRPVTTTRGWCPEWKSRKEWAQIRKGERARQKTGPNRFRSDEKGAPNRTVDTETGEIL